MVQFSSVAFKLSEICNTYFELGIMYRFTKLARYATILSIGPKNIESGYRQESIRGRSEPRFIQMGLVLLCSQ